MLPNNNSVWDRPGVMESARRLANDGKSSGSIAAFLSAEFGLSISRNAVIGRLSRSGIQLFGSKTNKPKIAARPTATKRPKPVFVPRPEKVAKVIHPEPIPMGDVDTGCRWIFGPSELRNFCGCKTTGGSWCGFHEQRVYQPATSWRDLERQRKQIMRRVA